VEAIARALSLEFAYYPASNHQGRDNGNAVLSRWPILSSWKVPLPHVARTTGEVRAAVGARILVGDRLFLAYSVHVSSPFALTPAQRNDQVAAVLADAAASAEPAAIGGDFNGWRIGRRLEQAGYAWVTRDVGASLVAFSVDHVFLRGLPAATVRAGVARDVRDSSDHRPVWTEIGWPQAASSRP
jgi:endonuclease/exonuclease/phosphatase family metal-dependent hydrolase